MFSIATLLLVLVAAIGSGVMVATFGWLFFRMKRIEGGNGPRGGSDDVVIARIDELRDGLLAVQDELARIDERMDFTERLLESGPDVSSRDDDAEPERREE